MSLKGKIVFITGASAGIGAATAMAFAGEGVRLLLAARRPGKLAEVASRALERGAEAVHSIDLDVRNRLAVQRAIDELPPEWAEIDILVNNAGLSRGMEKLYTGKVEDWEEMIDTNVKGLLYVSRAVVPGMVVRRRGHVVINSIAVSGLRSDQGLAQSLASRYRTYSNLLLAFSYMYIVEDLLPLVRSALVRRTFLTAAAIVSIAFCALSDMAGARFLAGKKAAVSAQFAAQWHAQSTGMPTPRTFANPALARQLDAGIFDVDLPVLQESVRLGVYTLPVQP